MFRYFWSHDTKVKMLWLGWEGSFVTLRALQLHYVSTVCFMKRREVAMIFSCLLSLCVFHARCHVTLGEQPSPSLLIKCETVKKKIHHASVFQISCAAVAGKWCFHSSCCTWTHNLPLCAGFTLKVVCQNKAFRDCAKCRSSGWGVQWPTRM